MSTDHLVTSVEALEALYGEPNSRALWKEIDHLNEDYQAFVRHSPFVVLASVGEGGTDCSPKGDAPGFVQIIDDKTLAIPDRLGNNRIDNLRNIVRDPRVSVLFLIPGIGETLRVNGRAEISVDPELIARFDVKGKLPRTVIVVHVDAVYFHCAKSIVRSGLWKSETQVDRRALPSTGAILERLSAGRIDGEAYDRELPQRTIDTLY